MLNVTLQENVLTVVTPITKETADKAYSKLAAYDEDGNMVCVVDTAEDGKGSISRYGLNCNTVVDGKLAVQMIMPMGVTMDDVKEMYGQALLEVNKHIDDVVSGAEKEIEAIDNIFA